VGEIGPSALRGRVGRRPMSGFGRRVLGQKLDHKPHLLSRTAMAAEEQKDKKKPTVIITIGMAGAGKSTFVNRISSHLGSCNKPPYVLNLDPAVAATTFEPNIDIRDTINYHEVMRQ
jgi:hypothetical protein